MPITARLDSGDRIKARSYHEHTWRDMIGSKDRPAFYCVACEAPMFPKTSSLGLQYFSHYKGGPDCVFRIGGAESTMHIRVKDYLTLAIDQTKGWEAFPEHRIDHDGHWRIADVYAKRQDGKVAKPGVFEVQLSAAPDSEILRRDAFYNDAGAVSTWLTMAEVPWFRRAPTLRIKRNPNDRLVIVDGLMKTDEEKAPETLLERFVSKRLADKYSFVDNIGIIGRGDWQQRPTATPRPPSRIGAPTGGSDDCSRQPARRLSAPKYTASLRDAPASDFVAPERISTKCGHIGCSQPAVVVLTFTAKAAGKASLCADHISAVPDHLVQTREAVPA